MSCKTYRLTATAQEQLKKALRETLQRWGIQKAKKYSAEMLNGFQYIAENYQNLTYPHRVELAKASEFSLHLIGHRYVAFQPHNKDSIIIVGIFHESMDMPARLKELQTLTRHEITALKKKDIDQIT